MGTPHQDGIKVDGKERLDLWDIEKADQLKIDYWLNPGGEWKEWLSLFLKVLGGLVVSWPKKGIGGGGESGGGGGNLSLDGGVIVTQSGVRIGQAAWALEKVEDRQTIGVFREDIPGEDTEIMMQRGKKGRQEGRCDQVPQRGSEMRTDGREMPFIIWGWCFSDRSHFCIVMEKY